jgi:DNA-binding MarR family transcriptional regulator
MNGQGIELLADPTRRRLIAAIAIRPRRPSSLADEIELSRPATTRQLRLLEDAGLIRSSRAMTDRRGVVFTMDPRSHGQITAWLAGTDIGRRLKPRVADDPGAAGDAQSG